MKHADHIYIRLHLISLHINTSKWKCVKCKAKTKCPIANEKKEEEEEPNKINTNQRHQKEYVCICSSSSKQLENCQCIFIFNSSTKILELKWIELNRNIRMGKKRMSLIFAPFFFVDFDQRTFNDWLQLTHTNTRKKGKKQISSVK